MIDSRKQEIEKKIRLIEREITDALQCFHWMNVPDPGDHRRYKNRALESAERAERELGEYIKMIREYPGPDQ